MTAIKFHCDSNTFIYAWPPFTVDDDDDGLSSNEYFANCEHPRAIVRNPLQRSPLADGLLYPEVTGVPKVRPGEFTVFELFTGTAMSCGNQRTYLEQKEKCFVLGYVRKY